MAQSIPETNPNPGFRKMGEALTTKPGTKRTSAENKLPEGLGITERDMANANSYGDGKTAYIHGKTFHRDQS
jgi:hypothetical protein